MNISNLFNNLFNQQEAPSDEIRDNGQLVSDKRDIENPVGKFTGLRHIRQIYKESSTRRRDVDFYKSEYDLPTIANAIQLDGFLRRSRNIFVEQILKNGFEIRSKSDRLQKYVKKRIKEIENLTGVPFYETVTHIVTQLATYGNCYVIKVRHKDKSKLGSRYRLFGKLHDPIVGLFVADATTMEIGLNSRGEVTSYLQRVRGELRQWDERDVIHLTYNKIPGTLTGMSSILPVLDDVRALRKLEEEIEILGFQYSVPLYLYKVGTKDQPAQVGEVDEVSRAVTNMPAYGMLVVPGNHTIEVPSNSNTPVDVLAFVEHFKKRIFSGLGVSPVAMGDTDTSNRNTSEVGDKAMQSITKAYQQIITHSMQMGLIRELLLDGGFKNPSESVEFAFSEIDIENQIKKETHILSLWQNNLITRTEARVMMDKDASIKDDDTFLQQVEMPQLEMQYGTQMEIAKIGAKASAQKATPSASTGKSKSSSAKNAKATISRIKPSNQHGTSTGRPKYVKNSLQLDLIDGLTIFNKSNILNKYKKETQDKLIKKLNTSVADLCKYYHLDFPSLDKNIIDSYIDGVSVILENKIDLAYANLDDGDRFDYINDMYIEFADRQLDKIDNLSKILLYKSLGYETILVTANDCHFHADRKINLGEIIEYADIPPYTHACACTIEEKEIIDE